MSVTDNEIHLGDIGTMLQINLVNESGLPLDVAAATVTILFQPPSTETRERDGAFLTDGHDGRVYYETIKDDLDVLGWWKMQALVEADPDVWHSEIVQFRVFPNL